MQHREESIPGADKKSYPLEKEPSRPEKRGSKRVRKRAEARTSKGRKREGKTVTWQQHHFSI